MVPSEEVMCEGKSFYIHAPATGKTQHPPVESLMVGVNALPIFDKSTYNQRTTFQMKSEDDTYLEDCVKAPLPVTESRQIIYRLTKCSSHFNVKINKRLTTAKSTNNKFACLFGRQTVSVNCSYW